MTTNRTFIPPIDNSPVGGIVQAILPMVFKHVLTGMQVKVSREDLNRLKSLEGQRVLLLPNHPSYEDPYVMFDLARQLDTRFNYVAAREVFDYSNGLQGWVFQHCGVYSIIRGKSDRESFKTTREKLAKGERPLVIFIEGEVSYENDTLIPFEAGVIQLAFWGLEDAYKQAKKESAEAALPPLNIVPVAMKYFYHAGWEKAADEALRCLEEALGLPVDHAGSHYKRIRTMGDKILSVHEESLGIKPGEGCSFDERITRVKHLLLRKMEAFLQISADENQFALDRVRVIRNRLDELAHTYEDDSELSPYEHTMIEHLRRTFQEFYSDLARVVQFLIYREGYLSEEAGAERTIEFIRRLEKEVFGKERIRHPRTAVVQLGEVINLKDRYPAYQENKKQTTVTIAGEVENSIRALLARDCKPLE